MFTNIFILLSRNKTLSTINLNSAIPFTTSASEIGNESPYFPPAGPSRIKVSVPCEISKSGEIHQSKPLPEYRWYDLL
jgi:hypothetical protein